MKKKVLLFGVLVLILIFGTITASAATEGYEGYYTYIVSDGEATIFNVNSSISGDIVIPETLGGYPVTSIEDYAFYYRSHLTNVKIPDSVTSIGYMAFTNCSSLTSVTIPDSVTSIGDMAFSNCTSLISIKIPDSVTSIGASTFFYCISLTSVTIPDSITSIGESAFSWCNSLTNITIPDSVTSIGDRAFSNCTSLTSIKIPDSVTSIGDSAFSYCSNLTNATIGNGVTSIGESAFYNCTSLTSITIPDSVTGIGNSSFYGCTSLTDVYYNGTEEGWDNVSIDLNNSCLTDANIHYVEHTKTTVDGNVFTVIPKNIDSGKMVILALYDGSILSEVLSATCYGNELTFTVTKPYTKAKVMVWNGLGNLKPVCSFEEVV